MKKIAAMLAVAGLATSAMAQGSQNMIDVKVRVFGSNGAWSDNLTAQSNDLVTPLVFEVGVFFFRNTGFAFATSVMNVVGSPYSAANGDIAEIIDNPDSALHPDGRVGNGGAGGSGGFNNGGQAQSVYATGTSGVDANRFRIAGLSNAGDAIAGGISIHQNTPSALGTKIDSSDGFLGYHFKLTLACYNGGAQRVVTINSPNNRINSYAAYPTNTSSTSTNIGGTGGGGNLSGLNPSDPATLTVSWAPAPASLGLLGLGGLVAGRRRR